MPARRRRNRGRRGGGHQSRDRTDDRGRGNGERTSVLDVETSSSLKDFLMSKRSWLWAAVPVALVAGVAVAQYPVVNMVADKVVQKYQSSTCEQLWQNKGKHGPEEQRLIGFLKSDPKMRQVFFDKIAGPVMNKMFECGMIP
jgi:hypothetical protein